MGRLATNYSGIMSSGAAGGGIVMTCRASWIRNDRFYPHGTATTRGHDGGGGAGAGPAFVVDNSGGLGSLTITRAAA